MKNKSTVSCLPCLVKTLVKVWPRSSTSRIYLSFRIFLVFSNIFINLCKHASHISFHIDMLFCLFLNTFFFLNLYLKADDRKFSTDRIKMMTLSTHLYSSFEIFFNLSSYCVSCKVDFAHFSQTFWKKATFK